MSPLGGKLRENGGEWCSHSDICRRGNGVELHEGGDELAEVKRGENAEC